MSAKRPFTVIVIPETGKRTLTFQLSRAWFLAVAAAGVLLIGLAAGLAHQTQINRDLNNRLSQVDDLKRANRLQEKEIESMRSKADEAAQKLHELEGLERQIRELTGESAPSRSGLQTDVQQRVLHGRGGPQEADLALESLPTLGAMLPPDVRAHLFAKRDTLQLNLKQPATTEHSLVKTLNHAQEIQTQLDDQLAELDRLNASLTEGKQAIADRLEYLAHRPTGYPVSGALLTDRFGTRWSPFGWGRQKHEGIDLAADYWTPIVSTGRGVVIEAGWKSGGYGYTVMIDHGYGLTTMYAHMVDHKVKEGDSVERGQLIGWVGSTGLSTGAHVHYEIHLNGAPVDPLRYIQ